MKGDEMSGDPKRQEQQPQGRLTYGGRSWRVTSAPEVIETSDGESLMEVWVKEEGEEGGQSG